MRTIWVVVCKDTNTWWFPGILDNSNHYLHNT